MSNVLTFTGFAETISFNGLGKNDGRSTLVVDRSAISGMHLNRIVPAQPHAGKLIIGEMLHHLQQPRIGAKQVLPEVRSTFDKEFLILTICNLAQPLYQQAVAVILNQSVPVASPDALDYVPTCAAENRLQFLNDLEIAAHWPIQPLQVAVDHPDQVVEPLA